MTGRPVLLIALLSGYLYLSGWTADVDFEAQLQQLIENEAETSDIHDQAAAIGNAWAQADLDAVLRALNQVESLDISDGMFNGILEGVGKDVPLVLLDWLENKSDRPFRFHWMGMVVRTWSWRDWDGAMKWVLVEDRATPIVDSLFYAFSERSVSDPGSAKETAERLQGQARLECISAVAGTVALENRKEALEWLHSLPLDRAQSNALGSVIGSWAEEDPKAASAYAVEYTKADALKAAANWIVLHWAQKDPDATLQWVEANFSGEDAAALIRRTVFFWATNEPQKASAALEEDRFTDPGLKKLCVIAVADSWANKDPAAATLWLAAHPEEFYEEQNISNVVIEWLRKDSDAAKDWIETLDSGLLRDAAIWAVVTKEEDEAPQSAFNWAIRMTGKRRDHAITHVLQSLAQKEGIGPAVHIIGASPLDDAEKEQMIESAVERYGE